MERYARLKNFYLDTIETQEDLCKLINAHHENATGSRKAKVSDLRDFNVEVHCDSDQFCFLVRMRNNTIEFAHYAHTEAEIQKSVEQSIDDVLSICEETPNYYKDNILNYRDLDQFHNDCRSAMDEHLSENCGNKVSGIFMDRETDKTFSIDPIRIPVETKKLEDYFNDVLNYVAEEIFKISDDRSWEVWAEVEKLEEERQKHLSHEKKRVLRKFRR